MPFPCHVVPRRDYNVSFPFDFEKKGMVRAWHGRGMTNVNQTRPHYANQMGETHSKTLAARHGRGTAWARHAMCESAFRWLGGWTHTVRTRRDSDSEQVTVKQTRLKVNSRCINRVSMSYKRNFKDRENDWRVSRILSLLPFVQTS
jgi:hypothetical protein